jgi:hypothetical protein
VKKNEKKKVPLQKDEIYEIRKLSQYCIYCVYIYMYMCWKSQNWSLRLCPWSLNYPKLIQVDLCF